MVSRGNPPSRTRNSEASRGNPLAKRYKVKLTLQGYPLNHYPEKGVLKVMEGVDLTKQGEK